MARQCTLERRCPAGGSDHIAASRAQLPQPVDAVEVTDEGVSATATSARDITLIEAEALEAFREETGIELSPPSRAARCSPAASG